jgi:hypothetical protein
VVTNLRLSWSLPPTRREQDAGEMCPWLDVVLNNDHHLPVSSSIVTIPQVAPQETALEQIENLLEGIVDAISEGRELTIPFRTTRSPQAQQGKEPDYNLVSFPGRTIQEAGRFGT